MIGSWTWLQSLALSLSLSHTHTHISFHQLAVKVGTPSPILLPREDVCSNNNHWDSLMVVYKFSPSISMTGLFICRSINYNTQIQNHLNLKIFKIIDVIWLDCSISNPMKLEIPWNQEFNEIRSNSIIGMNYFIIQKYFKP